MTTETHDFYISWKEKSIQLQIRVHGPAGVFTNYSHVLHVSLSSIRRLMMYAEPLRMGWSPRTVKFYAKSILIEKEL